MPALKTEPAGTIESLEEFFALAHAMETEAAKSYAEFAGLMREQGRSDLAETFERIAGEERGHAASVSDWSQKAEGHQPDSQQLRWAAPPTFERDDAAEIAGSRLLTPYRVLTIGVRNEERAFAFWAYVAAQTRSDEVRRAAEAMAREELEHVATFRRERRKAFHAGRQAGAAPAARTSAAELEAALATALRQAAPSGASAELAREADALGALAGPLHLSLARPEQRSAEALAEALADAYLQAADTSADEDDVARLQELGQRAILRLTRIRDAGGAPQRA